MFDSWGADREGARGRASSDPTGIKTSVPSCPKAGRGKLPDLGVISVRWLRKNTLHSTNIAGWKMDPDWRCILGKWGGYSIAMLVYQTLKGLSDFVFKCLYLFLAEKKIGNLGRSYFMLFILGGDNIWERSLGPQKGVRFRAVKGNYILSKSYTITKSVSSHFPRQA